MATKPIAPNCTNRIVTEGSIPKTDAIGEAVDSFIPETNDCSNISNNIDGALSQPGILLLYGDLG